MAVDAPLAPANEREAWIAARMAEFKADPDARDRAIATILCDILNATEAVRDMAEHVKQGGIGGLMKAVLGGR